MFPVSTACVVNLYIMYGICFSLDVSSLTRSRTSFFPFFGGWGVEVGVGWGSVRIPRLVLLDPLSSRDVASASRVAGTQDIHHQAWLRLFL